MLISAGLDSWFLFSDFDKFWGQWLEKEMAAHSSIIAWRILWMEEHGELLSIGSHRVGHNWSNLAAAAEDSDMDLF